MYRYKMRTLSTTVLVRATKCSALNMDVHWIRTVSQVRHGGVKFAGRNEPSVFDSKVPKSARIKAFRHVIYQSAIGKGNVNFSSLEVNLITRLVSVLKGGCKKNLENSLQAKVLLLNKSLLTQRLTDEDIFKGMNLVSGPVNVAIPRDISSQEKKERVKLQSQKLQNIDLHPSGKAHIEELLHSLNLDTNDHEEIYRKISLYLQKDEESVGASQHNHVDIDLKSLKGYLQNIEKRAHLKRAINKQRKSQTRTFEWNTESFSETVPLTAGSILFKRRPSRLWKRFQNGIGIFLNLTKGAKKISTANKVPEGNNILLHSLEDNKDITISNNFDYGLFNINFTDLFGVINSSGYPPERVLNRINDIELKGWECIGNLHDNSKVMVFQSSHQFSDEGRVPKGSSTPRKTFFISITALLTTFFAYYKYRLLQREEPN
ncbi:YPL168W-like protein [Saccharomyces cerevisiae x Saccharomyces kudriavzevii VIN7]|uniref:YPL168W-like protein n=1 Tax=Saccharomyces cerevisiae x Saccharomyces kudriavzevii (strain VIN7) TaxID=1095631 RepID=H0H1X5_SACCK|nr:YPL168W-like protein [Saccharomyces cerevisiae x Saccharomyces kudriavzevii VIN7]